MAELLQVTHGWTGTLGPFVLRIDGAPVDLTGFTVAIVIHDSLGNPVTPGGVLTPNADQSGHKGEVTYAPVASDFTFSPDGNDVRQPYLVHFKVTDGNGKVVSFPNGLADEIGVYEL